MILKSQNSSGLIPVALTEFKPLLGNVSIMSTIKKEISCQIVNINDNYLDYIHLIDYLWNAVQKFLAPFSAAIEVHNIMCDP